MTNKVVSPAAIRQKLHAERKANGLVVLHVLCDHVGIVEMLKAEGLVDTDEPDRKALGEALSKWTFREMTRHAQQHWGAL